MATAKKSITGKEEAKLWDYLTRKLGCLHDNNFTARQILNRVTSSFKPKNKLKI